MSIFDKIEQYNFVPIIAIDAAAIDCAAEIPSAQ
tara:strand:- start:1161 stop:1262 length:102 start_codon:yes stop_codon:yes gene_type:complete